LPPLAVCQTQLFYLNHRNRGQAPSHIGLCFFRSFCMSQLTHRRAVITGAAIIDGGLTVRWPD
jgi:hypothetical protein